jgi:glycosyltransferase involved in cell wall biosynthesis
LSNSNKKETFLFVMDFTCPFPGAGWWRIFNFARNFKAQGHRCGVLSCFSYSPLNFRARSFNSPTVVRKEDINVYNLLPFVEWNNHPVIFFLNSVFAAIFSLPSFLLIRPSVVIISVPPVDSLLPVFLISKIMRSKIVIDYRDELEDYLIIQAGRWAFFYRFLKSFLASLYKKATVIVSVTPAVAESLRNRNVNNVRVIHDGVDTQVFKPYDKNRMRSQFCLPQDAFVIAYLGNVYAPYRVDIVIRALQKLNAKNPERKYLLILAGGGDIKGILDLANNLGIGESVKYFGVIKNPTDVAKLLSSADCGVIPYDNNPLWQKTYSTKLFEYCAVGLPVIATVHRDSALAKLIEIHNLGVVTPPVNSEALASSLERLSADEAAKVKMGSSALQFAKRYDKRETTKDLLEAIKNV